jgi:hypothetical protein
MPKWGGPSTRTGTDRRDWTTSGLAAAERGKRLHFHRDEHYFIIIIYELASIIYS